jgi:bifunctional UDP-N-acetylglucosamine pyrophosphorylase / glucosamine-1-phosphate N-acetyltransferase
MSNRLGAVVMAAGMGTRMKSDLPKHLHPLLGRRLVDWVIEAVRQLEPDPLVVVASPEHADSYDRVTVAVQERPLGTGDAVRAARDAVAGGESVLIVSGDHPLLTASLLERLVAEHSESGAAATVLSFEPPDPRAYGRIVRDGNGGLRSIVEAADAGPEELAIGEVNSSIYVFETDKLWPALERLEPANVQGELYLTDAVRHLVEDGDRVAIFRAPEAQEVEGVNTRAELAEAAVVLRDRTNRELMLAGVTIVDPAATWIDAACELEPDSTIHPFTVLGGRTKVARGAEVGPHVVAVDSEIGPRALVGPFCYLRPGTIVAADAKAGTFVEVKNSRIGERTKVPHLAYIGDAEIGTDTNIGAGAITANYRPEIGPEKQRTKIGDNVHTASQNVFVAPVEIGDDAWTAAGSAITEDVPPGALAIARARQVNKEGYADRKRDADS